MLRNLLLLLLWSLYDPVASRTNDTLTKEDIQTRQDLALKYIFLFSGVLIVSVIRHVVREYDIPVPYSVFSILLGFLWGVGALYSDWMHRASKIALDGLRTLDYIYLPIIIFKVAFCIDVHAFFKSFSQILIISGPIAILSGLTTGIVMKLVIHPTQWEKIDGVLLGSLLIPVFPMDVVRCLKESTMQTKHVKILLEGETLITAWASNTIFTFVTGFMTGWTVEWYQFCMHMVRQLLLGVPVSYLFGLCGSSLMKVVYNDAVGIMLVTVAMCYCTFYYLFWLANAGILGNSIVGIMMGSKRGSLSQEMDRTVTTLWKAIAGIMSGALYINVGVVIPGLLGYGLQVKEYILVLVTYLVSNMTRFLSFFVFSVVLSRIGYGMTFQNMVICVWAGLKNPIALDMALDLYDVTFADDRAKAQVFFLHTVAVYFLMKVINGSCATLVIKALGLSELSLSRQMNMNNCMKYIYEARARTVAILKMDRFLADANWPLVMKTTAMRHPYKKKSHEDILKDREDEDEDYLLGHRYTFCPDCQKNVPNEPTARELRDMAREAKLRLLKLKKTAYSRLFENGMMSKMSIRLMHQAVEVAMDSEELVIELDGLVRLFSKEGMFYRVLRNVLQHFLKVKYENLRPPRKWWRRVCYKLVIVHQDLFLLVINSVVLLHVVGLLYEMASSEKEMVHYHVILYTGFFCTMAYLVEFLLKIFALSWILIFEHGVRNYFRSYWNILEFTVMCLSIVCFVLHVITVIGLWARLTRFVFEAALVSLLLVRLLRLLTFLKYCACCRAFTPSLIRYLEAQIDRHRALAYELAKNYLAGEEEILENLHQIVDNEKIREEIREKIDSDRLVITRKLGIAQKESPHVATTVKTKLAMRTVLNSMKDDVYELKVAGWVDDVENDKLLKSLAEQYRFIGTMKTIQPVPSKLIFSEVSYMGDRDEVIEFLYNSATTRKFEEGEEVYKTGDVAESVYILITGMLKVTYVPQPLPLERLSDFGALPVVDYVFSMTYDEPVMEYVVPGNSIGELSLLTERAYDAVTTAETATTVYVLSKATLEKALKIDVDPVNGLECRMWKFISFKRALTVMMNTPSYRSYTQEKIKYILERSFVPNLSNYKIFVVNEMMADIILIEGVAVDFNSRDIYTGPCYIPRAVQKLILPKSSYINMHVTIETKLLIIPAKDYDEYEIMMVEEQVCELVSEDTSKCLLHLIKDKGILTNKSSRTTRQMKSIVSGLRRKILGSDSVSMKRSNISRVSSKGSKATSVFTIRSILSKA